MQKRQKKNTNELTIGETRHNNCFAYLDLNGKQNILI